MEPQTFEPALESVLKNMKIEAFETIKELSVFNVKLDCFVKGKILMSLKDNLYSAVFSHIYENEDGNFAYTPENSQSDPFYIECEILEYLNNFKNKGVQRNISY